VAGLALFWTLAALVSPYVQPADGGEMQMVVRDLGVAHPPGYPLYTMVAHGFDRLVARPSVASLLGADPALVAAVSTDGSGLAGAADRWTWSTNLFSAALAAVTLLLVAAAARDLIGSFAAGLLAVAALASSPTFLTQSLVANIRMPTALATAGLLYVTLRLLLGAAPGDQPADGRSRVDWGIVTLALVGGLAVGHHLSLAPVAVLAAVLVLVRRPAVGGWRTMLASVLALAASVLPLLYLPLRDRAGATLAPGGLDTLGGFLSHVTGFGFRGDVLGAGSAATLTDRALVVANIAVIQLGLALLIAAAIGAAWLLRDGRPGSGAAALLLLGTVASTAVLAAIYRAPQTMEYLMPAYVALALLVGAATGAARDGARALAERLAAGDGHERSARLSGAALALVVVVAVVFARRDLPARVVAAQPSPWGASAVLAPECTASGASVLANWHYVTPIWFLADDVSPRPDLDVAYVYPEGSEPIGATWLRRLDEAGSPTVLTNRSGEMVAADVAVQPLPGTPFFTTEHTSCRRDDWAPVGVGFGGEVTLIEASVPDLGADAARAELVSPLAPRTIPDALLARFAARGVVEEPLTVFAQLVDRTTGTVHGQVDRTFSPARWNDQGGLLVRLPIEPYREDLPDTSLVLGVYRQTADGPERLVPRAEAARPADVDGFDVLPVPDNVIELATYSSRAGSTAFDSTAFDSTAFDSTAFEKWFLEPARRSLPVRVRDTLLGVGPTHSLEVGLDGRPRVVDPPAEAIPFGDAMWLVGSDVSFDERGDGESWLVVDLVWLSEWAHVGDYTVSAQIHAADGTWAAQHDGTPALGAIPTLKWLPGMTVRDRHRMRLPRDVAVRETPYTVTVGVYDAFSLEPLPVTRGDLVAAGQGQRVVVATN